MTTLEKSSRDTVAESTDTVADAREKAAIILAFRVWIAQRPGLEFGNYGDVRSYRAEQRRIRRDYDDALTLIRSLELASISAADIKKALQSAFCGRLSWDDGRLSYCCGQYWPTEYRKAVCSVCASALWGYHRRNYDASESPGVELRAFFRRCYGALAKRWFD